MRVAVVLIVQQMLCKTMRGEQHVSHPPPPRQQRRNVFVLHLYDLVAFCIIPKFIYAIDIGRRGR